MGAETGLIDVLVPTYQRPEALAIASVERLHHCAHDRDILARHRCQYGARDVRLWL